MDCAFKLSCEFVESLCRDCVIKQFTASRFDVVLSVSNGDELLRVRFLSKTQDGGRLFIVGRQRRIELLETFKLRFDCYQS